MKQNDSDDEDEKKNDKGVRLTLLEEVILVGLKDKEVNIRLVNSPPFSSMLLRNSWKRSGCVTMLHTE